MGLKAYFMVAGNFAGGQDQPHTNWPNRTGHRKSPVLHGTSHGIAGTYALGQSNQGDTLMSIFPLIKH